VLTDGAPPGHDGRAMRKLPFLCVAALLVAAVAATAAPGPPVITESFTLLPCPAKPKTTLDLEGCAEHRVVKTDAAINKRVKTIFSLLRTAKARGHFVQGERAWLAYRRATCTSRSDVYEGGSQSAVEFANCLGDLNDAHLKELATFEGNLRPH
jgi:uncharacterized protein YecT (DUF1311 family)